MAADKSSNLALLIDGDNVSHKTVAGLMTEIANYGNASVRRIYGDWTEPSLKGWKACLLDHSITPIQQFAYTTGKNATDGAMIIDAMDLLYTNRFSGFCLVSSDSDFTRLAVRIREQGVTVYGFGERKTANAFIAACNKFVYFDVLNMPDDEPERSLPAIPTSPQKEAIPSSLRPPQAVDPRMPFREPEIPFRQPVLPFRRPTLPVDSGPRPLDRAALDGLAQAVSNSNSYDGEFVNLAEVGHYLNRISPSLNARNYGYNRLREFVEASGIVDMKWKEMEGEARIALVRLKESH